MNSLYYLFERCLNAPYIHIYESSADYYIEIIEDTLYIYLECSNGIDDWKSNLNFPAKPYKRMGNTVWLCHRGFLKVWKSIEAKIADVVLKSDVKSIVTVGYSHGGALAVLCHEFVWYNRPDIRENIRGYGFGTPRVLWGITDKCIKLRWKNFNVIRNLNDIVTFLPPKLLGYFHVGNLLEIGKAGLYSPTDAHRPENILFELLKIEN